MGVSEVLLLVVGYEMWRKRSVLEMKVQRKNYTKQEQVKHGPLQKLEMRTGAMEE